jgi:hypothetical protein
MGTAAATSTKRVYQRSGIKERWFTKMMRQIQIKAAGNRTFFRPQNLPTDAGVLHTGTCVLFSSSRPNIRIHNLADWRTLAYGLPAMTAKQREDVRHKGIRKDLFPSLHAETGYIVFDPVRPIPEGTSEQKVSALFASTIDLGENIYPLYGRDRNVQSDNPDKTRTIDEAEGCMSRKHHYPLEHVGLTDSIPYRIPVYYPTLLERIRMPMPNKEGGIWGETKGHNRTWKPNKKAKPAWVEVVWIREWTRNAEWTAKQLPASDAEHVMLPLSKRIRWRRKRPREGGWSKYVKHVKHS